MDENQTEPTLAKLADYEGEPETPPVEATVPQQRGDPLEHCSQEIRDLVAEYHELSRRYPRPDVHDVFAESLWVDEVRSTPLFEQYRGKYVAVANRQVWASGDTDMAATVAGAKAHRCHPACLFVCYVDPISDWS